MNYEVVYIYIYTNIRLLQKSFHWWMKQNQPFFLILISSLFLLAGWWEVP